MPWSPPNAQWKRYGRPVKVAGGFHPLTVEMASALCALLARPTVTVHLVRGLMALFEIATPWRIDDEYGRGAIGDTGAVHVTVDDFRRLLDDRRRWRETWRAMFRFAEIEGIEYGTNGPDEFQNPASPAHACIESVSLDLVPDEMQPPDLADSARRMTEAFRAWIRGDRVYVPRRIWRWLIRHGPRSDISTVIGIAGRCIKAHDDRLSGRGRFSRQRLAKVLGLSPASVKRSCQRLENLGWIRRCGEFDEDGTYSEEGVQQRSINKHGGKVEVCLDWEHDRF